MDNFLNLVTGVLQGFSLVIIAELGLLIVLLLAIGIDLFVEYLRQGTIAEIANSKKQEKEEKRTKKILVESGNYEPDKKN